MIHELPESNKLAGFYIGTVLKHMSHGMLKVWIPSVYSDEYKENPDILPNCMQITPQFCGSMNGNGVFSYPNIGSTVVCGFANGDQNLPFTFGSLLGGQDAQHQYNIINQIDDKNTIKNSLNETVVLDQAFNEIYDINSTSKIHKLTSGKTNLAFFEDGIISARINYPLDTHISDLVEVTKFSDFTITTTDNEKPVMEARTIDLDSKISSRIKLNVDGMIEAETICSSGEKTYSKIIMDSKGNIQVNSTNQLNILIQKDNGSDNSHINMNQNGTMKIDTSKSLEISSPDMKINGKTLDINFGTSIKETTTTNTVTAITSHNGNVSINGAETVSIDSTIGGISFVGHSHTGNQGAPVSPPF